MGEQAHRVGSLNSAVILLLLATTVIGVGCGGGDGDGSLAPPTSGGIEITTATSGPEPDGDGYVVSIDDGAEISIGASGTIHRDDIAAGSHSIQLGGLAGNCSVEGENPRPVSVVGGEISRVDFAVSCGGTTGTIEISTVTQGVTPDADGYTVLVNGTERGSIGSSSRIVIDAVAPGSYGVGLSGIAANCRATGEALRTVAVTAGSAATVAFEVNCAAPPPAAGTLRITTNTSGPDADPDGYAIAVDAKETQPIGVDGSVTLANLLAGVHTVQLSGNESNCSVAGANPRTATVPDGGTVEMTFTINCSTRPPTTGGLQITTSTTGVSPDADGYSASTDGGPAQPIGVNESITLQDLAPGPHNVGLSGVSANCQVETNPRLVTIEAGHTATAAFSIGCTEPPPSTGTLRVTVVTAGPDQDPSGYTLAIDDQSSQVIGVNGTVSIAELSAGVHTVQLGGLARNCILSGTNPRSVTVSAGGIADASFSLTCTAITGTIEIVTTTTGEVPDPDGYTVAVDGGTAEVIEGNGSLTFELVPAGERNVELGGLAPNCHVVGGPSSRSVTLAAGATVTVGFTVSCPAEIRIVLTWGPDPYWDFDSHLTGPLAAESRFHVYYGAAGSLQSTPFAQLLNDAGGGGPETTIINRLTGGTYRFMVHDYSNSYSEGSTALGTSQARVEVYASQGLVQTFMVPNEPGTLWTVFEITGGTVANPTIALVNTMSDESAFGSAIASATDARLIREAVRAHVK